MAEFEIDIDSLEKKHRSFYSGDFIDDNEAIAFYFSEIDERYFPVYVKISHIREMVSDFKQVGCSENFSFGEYEPRVARDVFQRKIIKDECCYQCEESLEQDEEIVIMKYDILFHTEDCARKFAEEIESKLSESDNFSVAERI